MNRNRMIVACAVAYAVSWFLPVVKGGATITGGALPGWEAFRIALSSLWPIVGVRLIAESLGAALAVASALTNLLFLGMAVRLSRGARGRSGFAVLVAAAVLNAHWFVLGDERGDLRAGYYLWVASFVALAWAARAGASRPAPAPPTAAAATLA
jgi:hypothetical protein